MDKTDEKRRREYNQGEKNKVKTREKNEEKDRGEKNKQKETKERRIRKRR